MLNLRMREKLNDGRVIDISVCKRTPEGYYILTEFVEDVDYCDAKNEYWIWSIGKNYATGEILASTNNNFYQNNEYKCLFLR
jgi:hypothetical protein